MRIRRVPLTLVTGNKKKLEEFLQIMQVKTELYRFYTVSNRALDLDEL